MWRIVARDDQDYETPGPTWTFTTRANSPPIIRYRRPLDGATGQPINTTLSWFAFDIDAQVLTYDVYFGTSSPPPLVATNLSARQYYPGLQNRGTLYFWRVVVRDPFGAETSGPVRSYTTRSVSETLNDPSLASPGSDETSVPVELMLHQNVPNPFNPQTSIRYDLPSAVRVRLLIFDVNGRLVRTLVDEEQAPGSREVTWTGRDDAGAAVSSGVYFCILEAGKQRFTRKLLLLK
jgi:hypothetical protein